MIVDLAAEIKRLKARIASLDAELTNAAALKEHNRLLIESATQRELKLQEKEREVTRALTEIATLSPENERLRAEHAFYAKRAVELENHNRLLVESATEATRK